MRQAGVENEASGMQPPQIAKTLQVSDAALETEARWCESLAGRLAANMAPTGAASSSPLASAAAVAAVNAAVVTASTNTARVHTTAAKLADAARGYAANETEAAARMGAVSPPRVC